MTNVMITAYTRILDLAAIMDTECSEHVHRVFALNKDPAYKRDSSSPVRKSRLEFPVGNYIFRP